LAKEAKVVKSFSRNLAPDFTHYTNERPEMTSHDEESMKAQKQ
jgi:hypothetical protein